MMPPLYGVLVVGERLIVWPLRALVESCPRDSVTKDVGGEGWEERNLPKGEGRAPISCEMGELDSRHWAPRRALSPDTVP